MYQLSCCSLELPVAVDLGNNGNLTFVENGSHLPATARCVGNSNQVTLQAPHHSAVSAANCSSQTQALTPLVEEDIFQCGKCKQQFNILEAFVQHKSTSCAPSRRSACQSSEKIITATIQPINTMTSIPCSVVYGTPTNPVAAVINNEGAAVHGIGNCITSQQNIQASQSRLPISSQTTLNGNGIAAVPLPRIVLAEEMLIQTDGTSVGNISNAAMAAEHSGMADEDGSNGSQYMSSLLQQIPPFEPQQVVHDAAQQRSGACSAVLQLAPTLVQEDHSNAIAAQEKGIESILPQIYARSMEQDRLAPGSATSALASAPTRSNGPAKGSSGDSEDPKKKFRCEYCNKPFAKNFDLEQHKRSHTGEKPFQCIVCGRAFAQKSNVKKHMVSHKVWLKGKSSFYQPFSKERGKNSEESVAVDDDDCVSFVCEYCGEGFSSYNKRKSHMKVHKDQQVYKCLKEECSLTFRDLEAFVEHVKSHESGMTYRCHQCHKVFKTLHDLGVHQYQVHLNSKKKSIHTKMYACNLCPSKFSHPQALREHMACDSHKHICGICDATFTCERYLRKHYLLQHKGQNTRGATCSVCGKTLRSVYYLRLHMYIHTKELPYRCTKCDAAFNRKDKVKRHMLTHDSVKRFKCPLKSVLGCNKEFNRADKLKEHIISHSGVKKKTYACSHCPKTYSRYSSKVNHEKTHTSENLCKACMKGFPSQSSLKSHKCRKRTAGGTTQQGQKNAEAQQRTDDVTRDDVTASRDDGDAQERPRAEGTGGEKDTGRPPELVFTDLQCRRSSDNSQRGSAESAS